MNASPDKMVMDWMKAWFTRLLDPTYDALWTAILGGYEAAEITEAMAVFRDDPPKVKLGWAREQDPWPVVCCVLGMATPNQELLGKSATTASIGEGTTTDHQAILGYMSDFHVTVLAYTKNADYSRILADLIDAGLLAGLHYFLDYCEGMHFVSMTELQPNEQWAPEYLWIRAVTYQFTQNRLIKTAVPGAIIDKDIYVAVEGFDFGGGVVGLIEPVQPSEL